MRLRVDRGRALVTLMSGVALMALAPEPAHAQFGGFGGLGGFGFGFGFNTAPSPTAFLNQASLARMGHVHFGPQQNSAYAGNPNAYYNHAMDNGFVDRYRADRREPSYYGTQSTASRVPAESPSPAAPAARAQPSLPLGSFYKADGQIEWPSEAPVAEGLKPKRDEFEKLSKTVLDEMKKSGVASIASVSEARQKLLDYGRPALQYAKAHDTPRVADTFHLFLMSLYESLAQATNPAAPAIPAAAAPAG